MNTNIPFDLDAIGTIQIVALAPIGDIIQLVVAERIDPPAPLAERPFVLLQFNTQTGNYFSGEYDMNRAEALTLFAKRVAQEAEQVFRDSL